MRHTRPVGWRKTKILPGMRFNRWTVLRPIYAHTLLIAWECRCECGAIAQVLCTKLRTGSSKSCGCGRRKGKCEEPTHTLAHDVANALALNSYDEQKSEREKIAEERGANINGMPTPEYQTWVNIKKRCYDKKCQGYINYGGRGITVCDEWRDSFPAFLAQIGKKPSPKHSIDRIDNNRGYEPGNVRWATSKEQANNKRTREQVAEDKARFYLTQG